MKRKVIDANKHKYSISAMCKCLKISRQTYYYQAKQKKNEAELEEAIQEEFQVIRKIYGARKIKKTLEQRGIVVSRRKISRIMKKRNLKSIYTIAYYKNNQTTCNEALTENVLQREFLREKPLEAIVTDLTYVKVGKNGTIFVSF